MVGSSRRSRWHRFLPSKKVSVLRSSLKPGILASAERLAHDSDAVSFEILDRYIESFKLRMDQDSVVDWLALLIMQAPRAAHAQAMMDEHPRGYHDRTARLYELIDFNDTFVSTVLLLPESQLASFQDELHGALDRFCEKMYSRTFSDKQYEAIVHGLSREIAVFNAAKNAGFDVRMTSRVADAFGIDMQILDRATGRYINVDCKTSSSFHFRLKDLIREHRLSPSDMTDAETRGWWEIVNRKDDIHYRIILLRVSQDELGEIAAFRFTNEQAMVDQIKRILSQRSLGDNGYGLL